MILKFTNRITLTNKRTEQINSQKMDPKKKSSLQNTCMYYTNQ